MKNVIIVALLFTFACGEPEETLGYTDPTRTSQSEFCTLNGTCALVELEGDVDWLTARDVARSIECAFHIVEERSEFTLDRQRYDTVHVVVSADRDTLDSYYRHGRNGPDHNHVTDIEGRAPGSAGTYSFNARSPDQLTTYADWVLVVNGLLDVSEDANRQVHLFHNMGHILAQDIYNTEDLLHEAHSIWSEFWLATLNECVEPPPEPEVILI